jgi:hypothetical protein
VRGPVIGRIGARLTSHFGTRSKSYPHRFPHQLISSEQLFAATLFE